MVHRARSPPTSSPAIPWTAHQVRGESSKRSTRFLGDTSDSPEGLAGRVLVYSGPDPQGVGRRSASSRPARSAEDRRYLRHKKYPDGAATKRIYGRRDASGRWRPARPSTRC
jgi:hypothetical protein